MDDDFNPVPGTVARLEPGLRRILAPNPSPMTFRGTNTYILGQGDVAVIDPGPDMPVHLKAILAALAPDERISHILVTHSHVDHSPLAPALSRATGAPVYAFGDSQAGRSAAMQALADSGLTGGGEGVDHDFRPDRLLAEGTELKGSDWSLTALWTPGHFFNHMCFAWGDRLFTGDLIMGWASTMVSPPDGDLTAFMASTERLATRGDRVFYPGHGAPIGNPAARANWLLNHRRTRETEILRQLDDAPQTIAALTRAIYTDIPPALFPAAERNVFAHLIDLQSKSRVDALPHLSQKAVFKKF